MFKRIVLLQADHYNSAAH
nr:unnamed protein product [Callosobruchus chinensis]